ncbi:A1S_2505 family phage non-structural protein [Rhodanobacter sp. FW106-PBR-LB-1-21]|uniref:A1S_2505 family phage non-structural protein n=1 Tax=Rhodanobacter sp. FW106-PBR-LB-1-21 TaxID=3454842 RepID=UPI003F6F9B16
MNHGWADPVLVFGSNRAGRHGRGAAAFAARWRGARMGQGSGPAGQSYAIPTKDEALHVLPVKAIAAEVAAFLAYAREHASLRFDVSAIGCGLAGYPDETIAPLFADSPSNCRLPYKWQRLLDPGLPARVIVAGSRSFNDGAHLAWSLDRLLARLDQETIILSGGARGADTLGERYAVDRGLSLMREPADWDRYGRAAGMIRNQHMSFLASHLVAFWDGTSPGTRAMIEIARNDRLQVRVVPT